MVFDLFLSFSINAVKFDNFTVLIIKWLSEKVVKFISLNYLVLFLLLFVIFSLQSV
jgi:hypothetical protein